MSQFTKYLIWLFLLFFPSNLAENIDIAAIAGGSVGGIVAGGLCILALGILLVYVCCCYQKKVMKYTTSSTARVTTVEQPVAVRVHSMSQTTVQDGKQSKTQPEDNPVYDPMLQSGCASSPATDAPPAPNIGGTLSSAYYPEAVGIMLPATYLQAGNSFPSAAAETLATDTLQQLQEVQSLRVTFA